MENQNDDHHNHEHTPPKSTTTPAQQPCTTGICANCRGPTSYPPPPSQHHEQSEISPPPNYRPIRAPAINISPEQQRSNSQAIILAPVPHPEPVPVISDLQNHAFIPPDKKIHSPDDITRFASSFSGKNFLGFLVSLSDSIRGKKISDPCHESETVISIFSVMQTLIEWIDDIPPVPMPSRYGNVAYRTWYDRLVKNSEDLMLRFLGDEVKRSAVEIVPYFLDSFGNSSRIDYGTGHETNFAAWLYCLTRMGVLKEEDFCAVVSRVFVKYLDLMRKLQLTYCLEPAGSHGVWGLDDYHFLPFIFGSSQLVDHKYMKPKSIHNEDILENFSGEYMYLSCVKFIRKVKKGLFAEHSPLLDDISGVPNWKKVNGGLLKMYKVEVLEKVPIMQHFLFGSLIKWDD